MDIQITKDNVLIIMHDPTLDRVTDIANHPEYASRKTEDGFYVYDFTFAEI
jgi:glycerophosphoryl diester phosphodiesterase